MDCSLDWKMLSCMGSVSCSHAGFGVALLGATKQEGGPDLCPVQLSE